MYAEDGMRMYNMLLAVVMIGEWLSRVFCGRPSVLEPTPETPLTRRKKRRKREAIEVQESELDKNDIEQRADSLAMEETIFYNFKNGHFGIQSSDGKRPQFSMAGKLIRQADIFLFQVDKYSQQLVDVTDFSALELSVPRPLYVPVFNREMTAWEVVQNVSIKPRYPCVNILPTIHYTNT